MPTDKSVTVRTQVSGIVNGEALKGRVVATLNTRLGGTIEFSGQSRTRITLRAKSFWT